MIPREILKKIRQIEIRTNRLVSETLAGQYHSVFKGQGMNFDEVREYQPGDEVRAIDWNVTARMSHPFIKKFVEERELTLMLLVDVSGSGRFGSQEQSKRELAAEIVANDPLAIEIGRRVLNESPDWPASEMFSRQDAITAPVIASARAGALRFADQGDSSPIEE